MQEWGNRVEKRLQSKGLAIGKRGKEKENGEEKIDRQELKEERRRGEGRREEIEEQELQEERRGEGRRAREEWKN